jgi:hypothetical protein
VRGDAHNIVQAGSQNRRPSQPSGSNPALPCNPAIPVISSTAGEGERTCAGDEHEQSLPAGKYRWAKSYEQGKMIRWSLETSDKRKAKLRLEEYHSQPRTEPFPTRLKSPATWETAAPELLAYYLAYGKRRVHRAARQVRTLSKYFTGWALMDIDTAAI